MSKTRLLLVDGSHYLYRAFYAFPALMSPNQEPVGAILGVINMIRRLVRETAPTHILLTFDDRVATYRKQIYPDYKLQRARMPEAVQQQVLPLRLVLGYMGLMVYLYPGEEADDIIGTMAIRGAKEGYEVLIASGDKDLAQLAGEANPSLVDVETGLCYAREGVFERYGVYPEQIPDYLALRGDSSDNVPGVGGIGPKTAVALIEHFGTLDQLYDHLPQVANIGLRGAKRIESLLAQQRDAAYLSKHLVTLRCDLPLPLQWEQLHLGTPDWESLEQFFGRYRFRQWSDRVHARDLFGSAGEPNASPALPSSFASADRSLLVEGDGSNPFSVSTLDDGERFATVLEQHGDQSVAFGMGWAEDPKGCRGGEMAPAGLRGWIAWCVGDQVFLGEGDEQALANQWDQTIRLVLGQPDRRIILFDLQRMLQQFDQIHELSTTSLFDVKLAAYALDTRWTTDLPSLIARYLPGKSPKILLPADGWAGEAQAFSLLEQVAALSRLYPVLDTQLKEVPALERLFTQLDLPLAKVLFKMEQLGVRVDWSALSHQADAYTIELESRQQQLQKAAGEPFNVNSSQQLQRILFEKMGLPAGKKTGKGALSTREEVLVQLAQKSPFAQALLTYREIQKLMSTYVEGLAKRRCPTCSRVHTHYHAAMTRTGRLSSTDPNLQNIPIRSDRGRAIRRLFVPRPGYTFLVADYEQIELKIMAHLSSDEALLEAFRNDQDVHRLAAAEIYQLPPAEVTTAQRRSAKAVTFGLMYGMSAFGLSKRLNASREAAQLYLDRYFQKYEGVKRYIENLQAQLEQVPYVETLLGRRLYFSVLDTKGANRQAQLRSAINAPMQGSAADIMRMGMLAVDAWIARLPDPDAVRLLLQVHDELVFEVKPDCLDEAKAGIRNCLENIIPLTIPLTVGIGSGDSWEAAH